MMDPEDLGLAYDVPNACNKSEKKLLLSTCILVVKILPNTYFLVSDLSSSISPRKTPISFCGQGVETTTPPPFVDMSATNVFLKGEIDEDRSETKKYVIGSMTVDSSSFFSYLLHAFGT